MKSAFFISDVHLTGEASPQGEALLSLIRKAQQEADLFVVLGDLFDLWVGRSRVSQKIYAKILQEFEILRKTCRLIYLEGNHDFHLSKFWQTEIGFEVYEGPVDIQFANLKIRLEHGDEANPKDKGYIFLRWFLRTKLIKKIAEILPSSLVVEIGNRASHTSRQYTATLLNKIKVENLIKTGRTHALKLRETHGFDLMIVGHTHVADDYHFKVDKGFSRLVNLGSWFDGPHYFCINAEGETSNHKI